MGVGAYDAHGELRSHSGSPLDCLRRHLVLACGILSPKRRSGKAPLTSERIVGKPEAIHMSGGRLLVDVSQSCRLPGNAIEAVEQDSARKVLSSVMSP